MLLLIDEVTLDAVPCSKMQTVQLCYQGLSYQTKHSYYRYLYTMIYLVIYLVCGTIWYVAP